MLRMQSIGFQDLKFDPEKLSKTNSARQIQFKIYGKHNIAASTDNWKINLQIDERIAKHVIGIEVEAKKADRSKSKTDQKSAYEKKRYDRANDKYMGSKLYQI